MNKVFAELNKTIEDTSVFSDEGIASVNDSLNAGVHEINFTQYQEQVRISFSLKLYHLCQNLYHGKINVKKKTMNEPEYVLVGSVND